MESELISRLRGAHEVLGQLDFKQAGLVQGYSGRSLHVDLDSSTIEIRPVTGRMKDLWVGGKGFDLWLMLQEINPDTKWDSPENPICFSSGPLGGTTSFPGSGKTLVTTISPTTRSIMDCNVGGYFGPYMKFAGFDALTIVGKAVEDVIIFIDATTGRVSIEKAPLESIDSHVLAEEMTAMFAWDEDDRRNIAVVSSGRGAQYTSLGVLNFSFYDWRRGVARLKQAGRGGVGTVFRHKRIKALVIKNRQLAQPWKVAESKAAKFFDTRQAAGYAATSDRNVVRQIIELWGGDPEYVIEMMQDVQDRERFISMTAIDEICRRTGVPRAALYHIATFYKAFSLLPRGETVIEVCIGTTCHVKGAPKIIEAFERELDIRPGETTGDGKFSLEAVACLGCCSLAPAIRMGDDVVGNVKIRQVKKIVKSKRR
ncbi:MAG: aldehyde ferredoxin oxidoreductase N-terminal domain-containing protein [Pseudomonadota bacterium]